MTDRPFEVPDQHRPHEDWAALRLGQVRERARWIIFWERLWPGLAAVATVVGLFVALSWLGLWLVLPPLARAIGLLVFIALTAAAALPLVFVRFPSRADALQRLDRLSGIVHRPATAMADTMATPVDDPLAAALWRAHVERAVAAVRSLKTGIPAPRIAARDPYALRGAVLVLLIATFFAAGSDRWRRIYAAFDWHGAIAPANFRVDAWVTPPPYTGRPPILLPGMRPGEQQARADAPASFSVPAGSVLVVRGTGSVKLDLDTSGGLKPAPVGKAQANSPHAAGVDERRFSIVGNGAATLSGTGSGDLTWRFQAVPDKPPTIALTKDPEREARGSLKLAYKLEDDYGVVSAQATFAPKPGEHTTGAPTHPLYGPPDFALNLPQARTRNAVGQTIKDLSEHPWAGSDLMMTLVAKDDAGNVGRSTPREVQLPERIFVKPLARALIEQRRKLALDANARGDVLVALDALSMAPDKFETPAGVYLGLRSIYWELGRAKSDDNLRGVVQRLWNMAVDIEDGNLSDVEKALRAAEENLRQALERGASDEEIKKLMDQLRAAMDKFMQALAQQLRKNPEALNRPLDRNARIIRPQDLRNMLDRMENLARSGDREAARRMLEQLQQMMENLQMARPGQMQNGDDEMNQALDQLGDMIRRQQQLRDRTFRQGQDQRQDRERGQQGNQNAFNELQGNQRGLREQLNKLMEQLRKHGFGQQPGQQGNQQGEKNGEGDGMDQLGRAGKEMGEAEGRLGSGDADNAVDAQGRALEALRRGAQGMAQAMQQGGPGQGPGPGQPGRYGRARADQNTDPLGRPLRGRDYGDDSTVKVPGEIDVQRARRILEELRRRYGETSRPQEELDYIERLLKGFQ